MLKNALSAKAVASFKCGKHRDDEGLQFEVKGGSRRWTFSYMFEGRQRELAIGKYPVMSLAEARAKRAELREAKARGIDPKLALAGTIIPAKTITFRQDMDTFIAHMRGQWTAGSLKEWQQSMERIVAPLMDKPTSRLTQVDVVVAIKPAWETTHETARRVLGRVRGHPRSTRPADRLCHSRRPHLVGVRQRSAPAFPGFASGSAVLPSHSSER
jgi:Arm DNA-binding domain/Phage integrase central domain